MKAMGDRAQTVVYQNVGADEKTAAQIVDLISDRSSSTSRD